MGDLLGPDVVKWISGTGKQLVWASKNYEGKLLSIGSVLGSLAPHDVVWGSGALSARTIDTAPVTYLAVRGPLTRNAISDADVPEVYGDPAILLPRMYTPAIERRFDVGLVPHHVDRGRMRSDDTHIMNIDVLRSWKTVVTDIASCDVILSSSLHGIIVAEAYGIPAVWVEASDDVIGASFKFNDYYLSSGRDIQAPQPWHPELSRPLSHADSPPSLVVMQERLISQWAMAEQSGLFNAHGRA